MKSGVAARAACGCARATAAACRACTGKQVSKSPSPPARFRSGCFGRVHARPRPSRCAPRGAAAGVRTRHCGTAVPSVRQSVRRCCAAGPLCRAACAALMAGAAASSEWSDLGGVFYERREIYTLSWGVDVDASRVACAPFGGPVAIVRDDRKIIKNAAGQARAAQRRAIASPNCRRC